MKPVDTLLTVHEYRASLDRVHVVYKPVDTLLAVHEQRASLDGVHAAGPLATRAQPQQPAGHARRDRHQLCRTHQEHVVRQVQLHRTEEF